MGFTGLLNLAQIAFFAIGAYTSALLTLAGVPFWLAFISAGILPMLFGYLLSLPLNKLKGDYLALVTVGFTFIVYAVTLNWTELTRGPLGIPGIPKPEIFGLIFNSNESYLILVAIIALIVFGIVHAVTSSPFGKALEAVRDDELAAKVLGKDTQKMKSVSMMFAAFLAGLAGSLYAHYITFIDPSSFVLMQLIPIISIVVVGGLASLPGTFLATLILILLPEPMRFIGFPSSIVGPARQIIYAAVILGVLLYKPKGFWGRVEFE
jgi:branched-chain amino acid transport system permease protein